VREQSAEGGSGHGKLNGANKRLVNRGFDPGFVARETSLRDESSKEWKSNWILHIPKETARRRHPRTQW
jgi:hypothetical protein